MLTAWRPSPALARRALVVLVVGAWPRWWAAWNDNGQFWPDEIYQTLEQAHRVAFGYGFVPWEFKDGARSWFFPGLLGLVWKLLATLGVTRSQTLIPLAKLGVGGLGLLGIFAAMRLTEKRVGPHAALLAGLLGAFFPPSLVYGSRVMTETVSGPLVLLAVWLIDESGERRRRAIAAGAIMGAAIFLRYQNGVLAVGLLVLLLLRKRRDDAIGYAVAATALGLAGGVLDWITWGKPFWSFYKYLEFNLIEGKASGWGTSPFGYYFEFLWKSCSLPALVPAAGFVYALKRERGLVVLVLVYVVLHGMIPHKEMRFLMPVVPLALMLAAVGLGQLWADYGVDAWTLAPLGLSLSLCFATESVNMTFGELGQNVGNPGGQRSVWHLDEGVPLALWQAGEEPDVCGVTVRALSPVWTSASYAYFHRQLPFALRFDSAQANYVVAPLQAGAPGYSLVKEYPPYGLFHREGSCTPPSGGQDYTLP